MSTPSLINCPACNAQVSNQAPACPSCGQPIASSNHQTSDSTPTVFDSCSVCEEPIAPPATTCPACAHWKLTGEFPDHSNETRGNSTAYTYQSQPILPSPRMPGAYKVTVLYCAKNGFGALVAQQQGFVVTKGRGNWTDGMLCQ